MRSYGTLGSERWGCKSMHLVARWIRRLPMPYQHQSKPASLPGWMLLPHLALAGILDSRPLNRSTAVHALVVRG